MAAITCNSPLKIRVKRRDRELVRPASPTPQGTLYLSNLDDQKGLRFYTPAIQFFRSSQKREDPAIVIREALGRALVHFYPLAGRVKPSSSSSSSSSSAGNGKLVLHCTGDGVVFVEGDANVSLRHLFTDNENNYQILPPFPYLGEFIDDIVGSASVIDSPPVFIQVTRLTCGGFVFAISMSHCVIDGFGAYLLVRAIGEMANGAHTPSILPVWERERLMPHLTPSVNYLHYEYQQLSDNHRIAEKEMVCKSVVFSNKEIQFLKREASKGFPTSTIKECQGYKRFEVMAGYLWRLRTRALCIPEKEEVRLIFTVDIRSRVSPPLPVGYYGNAVSLTCAKSRAGDLMKEPLSFAVKLVRDAKEMVNEDYVRSAIDLMELYDRPFFSGGIGSFIISDLSRIGMRETDYGWGRAVYGGPARAGGEEPGVFMVSVVDALGMPAIAVPLSLPSSAMRLFISLLNNDLQNYSHSSPRASL